MQYTQHVAPLSLLGVSHISTFQPNLAVGTELRSRDENMSSCFCQNQHTEAEYELKEGENCLN